MLAAPSKWSLPASLNLGAGRVNRRPPRRPSTKGARDVIAEPTRDVLQACVRRESRSLVQYVRDVPLWVGPAERPALAKLKGLATAEQSATDRLSRYLQLKKIGLG